VIRSNTVYTCGLLFVDILLAFIENFTDTWATMLLDTYTVNVCEYRNFFRLALMHTTRNHCTVFFVCLFFDALSCVSQSLGSHCTMHQTMEFCWWSTSMICVCQIMSSVLCHLTSWNFWTMH